MGLEGAVPARASGSELDATPDPAGAGARCTQRLVAGAPKRTGKAINVALVFRDRRGDRTRPTRAAGSRRCSTRRSTGAPRPGKKRPNVDTW